MQQFKLCPVLLCFGNNSVLPHHRNLNIAAIYLLMIAGVKSFLLPHSYHRYFPSPPLEQSVFCYLAMVALLAACSLPLTSGCCYCRRVHWKITKLVSFNVLFLNNFIIPKSQWNAEHLIAFTGTHLESAKYIIQRQ